MTRTRATCTRATRACTRASRWSWRARATPPRSRPRSPIAGRFDVPVVARGGGTSLAGQTAGAGRRARHVAPHERDRGDRHRGAARAGRPGRRAGGPQPGGTSPRPRVRARHLHLEPGHDRRDDRQQLVRQPLDRLRHHGRPRPRAGGRAGRRLADDARSRDRPAFQDGLRSILREHADSIATAYPKHWRQAGGYRLDYLAREFNLARLVTGSEGTLVAITEADGRARAAAEGAHVRGRPLRVGGRRDRGHRGRARAGAGGGRDDRQHDPAALALQARVPGAVGDDRGRSRRAAVRDRLRGLARRGARPPRRPRVGRATTRSWPRRRPSRTR